MKKGMTLIMMVAIIAGVVTLKPTIEKTVKKSIIKMELNSINATSKELEKRNRVFKDVQESKFEKLKADKNDLMKQLKELQA